MINMEKIKGTDIYLLDQLMKGRINADQEILDAGCGRGRNMKWLADNGAKIYGCDLNPEALTEAQELTGLSPNNFKEAALDNLPYSKNQFDVIICSAVLHFANSEDHFIAMINELHRVLKHNGIVFIRMTSVFGLQAYGDNLGNGRFLLKDGTKRFLLTENLLSQVKNSGFELVEPLKSVLVEDLRSMTTLVLGKE